MALIHYVDVKIMTKYREISSWLNHSCISTRKKLSPVVDASHIYTDNSRRHCRNLIDKHVIQKCSVTLIVNLSDKIFGIEQEFTGLSSSERKIQLE